MSEFIVKARRERQIKAFLDCLIKEDFEFVNPISNLTMKIIDAKSSETWHQQSLGVELSLLPTSGETDECCDTYCLFNASKKKLFAFDNNYVIINSDQVREICQRNQIQVPY